LVVGRQLSGSMPSQTKAFNRKARKEKPQKAQRGTAKGAKK
jgi:hypothetical protein